ncbi:hypothetical protein C8Q75DRAFT_742330 [Abortiporus biennis]|nr:hypothetical protein C8Q75DRAFT_742330 [Abortiporus biennis]
MARHVSRSISLAASFVSVIFNLVLAVRLLALWRSLRWESESEWEGSTDTWRIDPVKLVWGLLSAYFAAAGAASVVGFVGIARNIPACVRFFRDYSIADLAFIAFSTITLSYTSFRTTYVRSGVCEELSRQPELMRDIAETGLSLENCEFWFERAIIAALGITFVLIAVRLHFVIALSKFYNQLRRDKFSTKSYTSLRQIKSDSMQRIYLLLPSASTTPGPKSNDEVMVYAPISVSGMSEQEARSMNATEAWIATCPSSSNPNSRGHRHSHSHSYSHSRSSNSHSHRHSRRNTISQQHRSEASPSQEKLLIDVSD